MAEAAIITACMVVVFACMWAAVSYQNAKIRVMDDARAEAWQRSLSACAGGDNMMDNISGQAQQAAAGPIPDTSKTGELLQGNQVTGMSEFKEDSGYISVTRHRMAAFPGLLGGATFDMQSKMQVRCNEPTLQSQSGKQNWVFGLAFAAGLVVAAIASLV